MYSVTFFQYMLCANSIQTIMLSLGNKAMLTDNKFDLSMKCIMLCTGAQSVLEDLYAKIEAGNITLAVLSKIKEKYNHIKKIISGSTSDLTEATVLQLLETRFKEQDLFIERIHHLGQICLSINIPIKGNSMLYHFKQCIQLLSNDQSYIAQEAFP